MPVINCPTCARSIDLPLEYLSIWVECKECAQQFLPLTGDRRASVLNERRSFNCQVCSAQFTTYAKVSSNRPHCPKCTSSDTLPSEVAALLKAHQQPKPVEIFNPIDPKLGSEAANPSRRFSRVNFQRKTKDDRAGYWIVALVTGVVLVLGGTILLLVALIRGKEEKKAKAPDSRPSPVRQSPEPRKEPEADRPGPELTWKRFESREGRFRITMPSPVIEKSRQIETVVGSVSGTQFDYERPRAPFTYSIGYFDFSPAQLANKTLDQLIDIMRDNAIRGNKRHIQSDKPIKLNEYQGREIEIEVQGEGTILCRYYKADQRIYGLFVIGKGADWGGKDVDAFFDSFEITGPTR